MSYNFNTRHREADLATQLIKLTGVSDLNMRALPSEWVIDWPNFFSPTLESPQTTTARKIDTTVAKGLHSLPPHTIRLFNAPSSHQGGPPAGVINFGLPSITLLRGARVGLPTGQAVAHALGYPAFDAATVSNSSSHAKILKKHGFDRDTPLWYYILREAEITPEDAANLRGTRLGPVGSRLVADVILDALEADPASYLNVAPSWRPTLPMDPTEGPTPFAFRHILRFISSVAPAREMV